MADETHQLMRISSHIFPFKLEYEHIWKDFKRKNVLSPYVFIQTVERNMCNTIQQQRLYSFLLFVHLFSRLNKEIKDLQEIHSVAQWASAIGIVLVAPGKVRKICPTEDRIAQFGISRFGLRLNGNTHCLIACFKFDGLIYFVHSFWGSQYHKRPNGSIISGRFATFCVRSRGFLCLISPWMGLTLLDALQTFPSPLVWDRK